LLREILAGGPFVLEDYVYWHLIRLSGPEVLHQDTEERAYQEFIRRFPDSPFVFDARRIMETLAAMRERNRQLVLEGVIKPPSGQQAPAQSKPEGE
jgi:hypothetical protein